MLINSSSHSVLRKPAIRAERVTTGNVERVLVAPRDRSDKLIPRRRSIPPAGQSLAQHPKLERRHRPIESAHVHTDGPRLLYCATQSKQCTIENSSCTRYNTSILIYMSNVLRILKFSFFVPYTFVAHIKGKFHLHSI